MVELRNLKGTKDYLVAEKLIQNKLISIIIETFQKFGFNPIETPVLEFTEILSSKYAGGAEILKEMYTLKDNGNRDLALRYDLTVPFCRFVGMNQDIKLPFKRFEIGKVFRDGPIKLGRLREFYQCDADVVGSKKLIYDAECLAIMSNVFSRLGKEFYIEINNRKLLFGIIKEAGIEDDELASSIILSIDKLKKIGPDGVKNELLEKGIGSSVYEGIFKNISFNGTNNEIISKYEGILTNPLALEGIKEIKTVLNYCEKMEIAEKIIFRPELARGLEIYTGTIFEAFFKDSKINSSIAGGGRYDKIIGRFLEKDKEYPSVGFSIGIDVILSDIMEDPESYPNMKLRLTSVEAMLIPIKLEIEDVLPIITELRNSGISCDLFAKKKGVRDALGFVNFMDIPISIIVGKKELESGKLTIRDMKKEEQLTIPMKDATTEIKKILGSK